MNTNHPTTTRTIPKTAGLRLNWYDLSVAGLVVVASVGALCRLLGAG